MYRAITRHVLAPGLDMLRGTHTMRSLKELEESQWWPLERIQEVQSTRLQRLIQYVYERVPYYRRLMDDAGVSPDSIRTAVDLPRLPVLTKADIRQHRDRMRAEGFPARELHEGRTSGSTGTPLRFLFSRSGRYDHGLARSLRALEMAGIYSGDPVFRVTNPHTRGRTEDIARGIVRLFSRQFLADAPHLSDATLPQVVERIARVRPRSLGGFASSICIIAEFIRESGMPAPEVGAIVLGGEQLLEPQRALLREVFGKEPFSKYSSYENYDIAMECASHTGLHVAAEDLIVEIVGDDGRPLPQGHVGHVLVTNLHEYGMPLIRYDTDDESSYMEGVCECGRALPRLSSVIGRAGSALYTPSGKRVSGVSLGLSRLASLGVRQFQLIQERLEHVTVKIVPEAIITGTQAETLVLAVRAHLGSRLGNEVQVDVVVVNHIEPSAEGKHLYLISKVTLPGTARA